MTSPSSSHTMSDSSSPSSSTTSSSIPTHTLSSPSPLPTPTASGPPTSPGPPKSDSPAKNFSLIETLSHAKSQALRGGLAGASAQGLNVFALMWLRTTMNYQMRHGGSTTHTINKLYKEGGVPRFYRGLVPALMQSPLSRFGDTAANVGVLAFLDANESTRELPIAVKTVAASAGAATWRLLLMPIDAWKTIKQVEGGEGLKTLSLKVKQHGIHNVYHGSVAAMCATFVGHYPWFFIHNYLSATVPKFDFTAGKYVRNAMIGFCASVVSDTCSNSIRVLKTTKQTSTVPLTYAQTFKEVVNKDGLFGLFTRGLKTRIIGNAMQGMLFSVGWKTIQDLLDKRK
eukprot:GHVQ01022218.1.p1 GENE.GHVQ01022218.1~~GHVQ01022218.1.p1  ORF type:complete len:342 (-),score=63.19 GHVQ01022218.1:119-1144(-)